MRRVFESGRYREMNQDELRSEAERLTTENERLVTAIGKALGAYGDWLHGPQTPATVARIIKPLTDALEGCPQ